MDLLLVVTKDIVFFFFTQFQRDAWQEQGNKTCYFLRFDRC